jgi:hypothetical protein
MLSSARSAKRFASGTTFFAGISNSSVKKTLMRLYISSLPLSAQTNDVVLMRLHYRQATTMSRKITTDHAAGLAACRKIH